jgi:phospholipid/cholesterol/gamma-HCH transport system permease protein
MVLGLSGEWKLSGALPSAAEVEDAVALGVPPSRLGYDSTGLGAWDSGLIMFLLDTDRLCGEKGIAVDKTGLPGGVQRLVGLAQAVPEQKEARKAPERLSFLARLGGKALALRGAALETLSFIGEVTAGLGRLAAGRAQFRASDMWLVMQESGSQALPIVSLISFLVGLILAFVGAIQLRLFGAQIYVADLVGIAMIRAMGAIMAGVIMAGRTGASFAAQIGTMQVNEEVDALKTSGISPIDFLVLPRVIALTLMMPLLTLYADFMGVMGGLFVAVTGLNINPLEFYAEIKRAVPVTNLWIGLFCGLVFGILVSLTGCLRGIQCGRSASAVGDATRSAVVTGIVCIVIATAIITVLCDILKI